MGGRSNLRSAGLRVRHCKGCGGCCADAVRVRVWRLNTPLLTLHALSSASCSCPLRAAHSPRSAPGSCPHLSAVSTLERDRHRKPAPERAGRAVRTARGTWCCIAGARFRCRSHGRRSSNAQHDPRSPPRTCDSKRRQSRADHAGDHAGSYGCVQRPHSSAGAFFSLSISSKK